MGLLLFGVVYRPRVAKVAEVAWFMGGGLLSLLVSNIYVSLYFVSRSQGSRSSMVFGVGGEMLLLTLSSVVVLAMVAKVGGAGGPLLV